MRRSLFILGFLVLSALPLYGVVGCGPGTDMSTCGNVGDPYEGGAFDPTGKTSLNACLDQADTPAHVLHAMTENTSYYLTGNIVGDPALICFAIRKGDTLDLRGYTVTGRIDETGLNPNGIVIFNGTVNCNVYPIGATCIRIGSSNNAFTAKTRLHHLTAHNSAHPGTSNVAALYVDWGGTPDPNNLSIEIDHITGYVDSAPTSTRATFMRVTTGRKTAIHNTDLTCNADVKTCNLIEIPGGTGYVRGEIYSNRWTITTNTITNGVPRAIDISGDDHNSTVGTQGWQVHDNYCTANNGRCFRFRQVSDILVYNNEVVNCTNTPYGCYHLADPSAGYTSVTLTASNDWVAYASNPYVDGQKVGFTSTSHGITSWNMGLGASYWVCNRTAAGFQIDAISNLCLNCNVITSDGTNNIYISQAYVGDALANIYNETIHMDTGGVAFFLRDGNGWTIKNSTIIGTHGKLARLDTPIDPPPGGPVATSATLCGITGAAGLDVDSTAAASTTVNIFQAGTWTGAGTINVLGSCAGVGGPPGLAVLSPTTLTFGGQVVGTTSGAQTITLSNPGDNTLNITSIVASTTSAPTSPGDFAIASTTCGATLVPAASCTVNVSFTPVAGGSRTGRIRFTTDAATSPDDVSTSGTGQIVLTLRGGTFRISKN
jgi:hypothetical protein